MIETEGGCCCKSNEAETNVRSNAHSNWLAIGKKVDQLAWSAR
jgi:hypothetical protein